MAEAVGADSLILDDRVLSGFRLNTYPDLDQFRHSLISESDDSDGHFQEIEVDSEGLTLYLMDGAVTGIQDDASVIFRSHQLIGASPDLVMSLLGGEWDSDVLDYGDVRCRAYASKDGLIQIVEFDGSITSLALFNP